MAKQSADRFTADLLGNRPGRPAKPDSLTGAQRAQRYRARRRVSAVAPVISVTRNENSCEWCGAPSRGCSACDLQGDVE